MTRNHPADPYIHPDMTAVFLTKLEESGSERAAVVAAAQFAKENGLERLSFRSWSIYREKNRSFRLDWDLAESAATAAVEVELRRRALEGTQKGIYYMGEEVAQETVYDNNLLLRLAKRHNPEAWTEKSTVDVKHDVAVTGVVVVSGTLQHTDVWRKSFDPDPEVDALDAEIVEETHQLSEGELPQ